MKYIVTKTKQRVGTRLTTRIAFEVHKTRVGDEIFATLKEFETNDVGGVLTLGFEIIEGDSLSKSMTKQELASLIKVLNIDNEKSFIEQEEEIMLKGAIYLIDNDKEVNLNAEDLEIIEL